MIKLLWLAIRDIEDKRARERAKEAGLPRDRPQSRGPARRRRQVTTAGKPPSAQLAIAYPDRINPHL